MIGFNYRFLKKKISYKNFFLENLLKKDIEKIRVWRNQQKKVLRQNQNISKKKQIDYFKNYITKQNQNRFPKTILFAFKKNNDLIGYGGFVNISWKNNNAEISYLLNTNLAKKKTIYEKYSFVYFKLINKFAFNNLNFKRIYTETFYNRYNHIKILEMSGFKKERTLYKHDIKQNKSIDLIVHSIVK